MIAGIIVSDPRSEAGPSPAVVAVQDTVKVVKDAHVHNTSRNGKRSFSTSVTLWVKGKQVDAEALVDSGATANFINYAFAKKHNLGLTKVATPVKVTNADGTHNKAGAIMHTLRARLQLSNHTTENDFYVINLGDKDVFIGYSFLYSCNPEIDWQKGIMKFTRCSTLR